MTRPAVVHRFSTRFDVQFACRKHSTCEFFEYRPKSCRDWLPAGPPKDAFIASRLPAERKRPGYSPSPFRCIATGRGARVARLRCPILRAGKKILSRNHSGVNLFSSAGWPNIMLSAGSPKSEKRKPATAFGLRMAASSTAFGTILQDTISHAILGRAGVKREVWELLIISLTCVSFCVDNAYVDIR